MGLVGKLPKLGSAGGARRHAAHEAGWIGASAVRGEPWHVNRWRCQGERRGCETEEEEDHEEEAST